MRTFNKVLLVLIIIGALNWGIIGLFNYDFISAIFGVGSTLTRVIFTIVGLAGLWCTTLLFSSPERREHGSYETRTEGGYHH